MPKPEDFHCAGCAQHYVLHKGGKNLPCTWCEQHAATDVDWWR
ncbi:hypothetical protein [Streptomyces flavofungini]